MDISCAFATALDTPEHIAVAEQLGYQRAWCYDSPGLYPDVWMVLARAAERTSTIGLGPGVLVPSLRHPMVNAAAIAGLAAWAPGRVAVAMGSGFTGRLVLGQPPMRWADVEAYVRALRGLLRGETVEWEGRLVRMLHTPGCAAPRPVEVPILIGADGPKGFDVAARVGDGVFSVVIPRPDLGSGGWRALLAFGTVLDEVDGEHAGPALSSPRARAGYGPGIAVAYHALYARGGAAVVDSLPGGQRWRESVEQVPEPERHLAVHEGHLVELNRHDELIAEEASVLARAATLSGTTAEVRERIEDLAARGVTEVAFQPAGPDIAGELERFAAAAIG